MVHLVNQNPQAFTIPFQQLAMHQQQLSMSQPSHFPSYMNFGQANQAQVYQPQGNLQPYSSFSPFNPFASNPEEKPISLPVVKQE